MFKREVQRWKVYQKQYNGHRKVGTAMFALFASFYRSASCSALCTAVTPGIMLGIVLVIGIVLGIVLIGIVLGIVLGIVVREKNTAIRGRATEEANCFTPAPYPPYAMRFPKSLTAERIFKTVLLRSFLWLQGNLSALLRNIPLKVGRRVHGII